LLAAAAGITEDDEGTSAAAPPALQEFVNRIPEEFKEKLKDKMFAQFIKDMCDYNNFS